MIKVDKKEENKKIVNNTNKDDKKDKEENNNEKIFKKKKPVSFLTSNEYNFRGVHKIPKVKMNLVKKKMKKLIYIKIKY